MNSNATVARAPVWSWRKHAVIGLLMVCLTGLTPALAKSYQLTTVEQDVYLQSNGTVRIVDTRTFDFQGHFSEAFLTIDPAQGGSVRFEGVTALDGKTPARTRVSENTITWDATANNETRVFRIAYTLTGELQVARDAAQFDRQVLEPVHVPVGAYTVRLHAPAPSPERYRVFVFTGQSRIGSLEFDAPKQVATVRLSPVGENEFVRTRVLLAPQLFATRTIEADRFEAWLEEVRGETQGFREASRGTLERGGFAPPTAPIAVWWLVLPWLGVAVLVWRAWSVYWRYGREPGTPEVGRYAREPAEDIPPGAVPYVLTQSNPGLDAAGPAVAATLLDFARRGFIELESHERPSFLGFGGGEEVQYRLKHMPDPGKVTPFERELWLGLEWADNGDGVIRPSELRRYFERHRYFTRQWVSMPRTWYESTHGPLLDPNTRGRGLPFALGCFALGLVGIALGLLVLMAVSVWLTVSVLTAALAVITVGVTVLFAIRRWNPQALLNAKRWRAYRNFLTDFSQLEQAPPEHYKLWDYHFVYATALGVGQRYLRHVRRLMESRPESFATPAWVSFGRTGSISANLSSLAQVQANLASLESALSSSVHVGGGFGGASAGGSSGGGSASGAH